MTMEEFNNSKLKDYKKIGNMYLFNLGGRSVVELEEEKVLLENEIVELEDIFDEDEFNELESKIEELEYEIEELEDTRDSQLANQEMLGEARDNLTKLEEDINKLKKYEL